MRSHYLRPLAGRMTSALLGSWIAPRVVRSMQRGTIAVATGSTSNTATITSVDMAQARLRALGFTLAGSTTVTDDKLMTRLTFTNATTITAQRQTSDGTASTTSSYEVSQYFPGVLRSIQRGTIATATTNTATITAVNVASTELDSFLATTTNVNSSINDPSYLSLTNATTITATATTGTSTTGYQATEFA